MIPPKPAFEVEERKEPYVLVRNANIRTGPGIKHDKVTTLKTGTEVTVTGKVKGQEWYRIAYAGGTGFVYGDLIQNKAGWEKAEAERRRPGDGSQIAVVPPLRPAKKPAPGTAAETFARALAAADGAKHDSGRDRGLAEVAEGLAEVGEAEQALRAAASIRNGFNRADALAHVAGKLIEGGLIEEARKAVSEGMRAAEGEANEGLKFVAWSRLVAAQAALGDTEEALRTARAITKPGPLANALGRIAGVMTGEGKPARALRLVEEAHAATQHLSDMDRAIAAYLHIFPAQVRAGDVDGARKVADAFVTKWRDNGLNSIARAQVKSGHVEGALQTTVAISKPIQKVLPLTAIAVAQAKAGQVQAAERTFAQALAAAKAANSGGYLLIVAEGQAKSGDVPGALETVRAIGAPLPSWRLYRVIALSAVAATLTEAGQISKARKLSGEAIRTARDIENPKNRVLALRRIVEAQVAFGDRNAAKITLSEALRTTDKIDAAASRAFFIARIGVVQAKLAMVAPHP